MQPDSGRLEGRARQAVYVAGIFVMQLAVLMAVMMPSAPVRANLPGITSPVMGLELATEPEHVLQILGMPGDAGREAAVAGMDRGNLVDFLFLLAYPSLQVALGAWLVARQRAPRSLVAALIGLALVMAAGDAVENVQLLALSRTTEPGPMEQPLAWLYVATRAKWTALFAASALLAAHGWREPDWRGPSLLLGLAAALAATGPLWLPAVELALLPLAAGWLWWWVSSVRRRR